MNNDRPRACKSSNWLMRNNKSSLPGLVPLYMLVYMHFCLKYTVKRSKPCLRVGRPLYKANALQSNKYLPLRLAMKSCVISRERQRILDSCSGSSHNALHSTNKLITSSLLNSLTVQAQQVSNQDISCRPCNSNSLKTVEFFDPIP